MNIMITSDANNPRTVIVSSRAGGGRNGIMRGDVCLFVCVCRWVYAGMCVSVCV